MSQIENFWARFSERSGELGGETPSSDATDDLLEHLRKIDPRLYYHLGSRDAGTDLILSAEGHPDLMPLLQELKQSAPSLDRWEIVVSYDGMLIFGERNIEVFPNTENGDVLFRMASKGDRPWISRPVTFSVVFPTLADASAFAEIIAGTNTKCEVSSYNGAEGFSHQAEVTTNIVATHQEVTDFENYIGSVAAKFGGRNDGWGCFMSNEQS
jgi:hypothetical protein